MDQGPSLLLLISPEAPDGAEIALLAPRLDIEMTVGPEGRAQDLAVSGAPIGKLPAACKLQADGLHDLISAM